MFSTICKIPQYPDDQHSMWIDMIVNPSNIDQVLVFSTLNIQNIIVYDMLYVTHKKLEQSWFSIGMLAKLCYQRQNNRIVISSKYIDAE